MPEGDVETFHEDGKWRNRIEGHETLAGEYDIKETAVAEGRAEAMDRQVEHLIRDLDGRIGARNSYGNDPHSIPG
ncbi:DUF2188 domain-containing protein [Nocardioides sp. SYSU DS0663]|uniref:DUF2188 domain-containing protein n=1 Tax=Nocardioides sp. SYSU DS0663 TaxID=3416445 RepID=UPI003F4B19B5